MNSQAGAHALTFGSALLCPRCRANFPTYEPNFRGYFSAGGASVPCPNPSCGGVIDWWELVLGALASGALGQQYAPVGALRTVAKVTLERDHQTVVDFSALGIPGLARILEIDYTPGDAGPSGAKGVLMPLEVHSNTPRRHLSAEETVRLYPMPLPLGGDAPDRQAVSVMVVWIDEGQLSIADASLVSAVEALNGARAGESVIPAAAAVEVSVEPVLSAVLERFAERGSVAELLRRAGAAGQIDVLLPTVAALVGAPALPERPAEALRQLRSLRNRAAHDGAVPAGTTREQLVRGVAGAIFGRQYARLIAAQVAPQE